MEYQLVILPTALAQMEALAKAVKERMIKRMYWLQQHTEEMIHHPLVGMPSRLAGLCKLRNGDYRILYWKYPEKKLIEIFAVGHRSEIYKKLR